MSYENIPINILFHILLKDPSQCILYATNVSHSVFPSVCVDHCFLDLTKTFIN